ncbi:hypothetical protein Esti_001876 [Eimeria stiedai]
MESCWELDESNLKGKCQHFQLEQSASSEAVLVALEECKVQLLGVLEEERLLGSAVCTREAVAGFLKQKEIVSHVFKAGHASVWRAARFSVSPSDACGSFSHKNRSGDKLQQISEWLQQSKGRHFALPQILADASCGGSVPAVFVDVCCGPGTWSQWLLTACSHLQQQQQQQQQVHGIGVSLTEGDLLEQQQPSTWRFSLKTENLLNFSIYSCVHTEEGSGNLYTPMSVSSLLARLVSRTCDLLRAAETPQQPPAAAAAADAAAAAAAQAAQAASLAASVTAAGVAAVVLADGSVSIPAVATAFAAVAAAAGTEGRQELLYGRLLLSQLLLALKVLRSGGLLVLTLFDCFSDFTVLRLHLETRFVALQVSLLYLHLVGIGFRRFGSSGSLLPQPFASSPAAAPAGGGSSRGGALLQQAEQPLMSPLLLAALRQVQRTHAAVEAAAGPHNYRLVLPSSLLPRGFFQSADERFAASAAHMTETLCQRQTESLQKIYGTFLILKDGPQQLAAVQRQLKSLQARMQLARGEAPGFSGHARQLKQRQQQQQGRKTAADRGASAAAAVVAAAPEVEEGGDCAYTPKSSLERSVSSGPGGCCSDGQRLPAAAAEAAASAATEVAMAAHAERGPGLALFTCKGEGTKTLLRGLWRRCLNETVSVGLEPEQQQPAYQQWQQQQQQRQRQQQQQGTRKACADGACKPGNKEKAQTHTQQAATARGSQHQQRQRQQQLLQLAQQQQQHQQQQRLRLDADTEGGYPRCWAAAVAVVSAESVLRPDGSPPLLLMEQLQQQQQQQQQEQQQQPRYLCVGSKWQLTSEASLFTSEASSPKELLPVDAHEAHWKGFLLRFRLAAEKQQQRQQRQGQQQHRQQQQQQHQQWQHRHHQRSEYYQRQGHLQHWQQEAQQQEAQQQQAQQQRSQRRHQHLLQPPHDHQSHHHRQGTRQFTHSSKVQMQLHRPQQQQQKQQQQQQQQQQTRVSGLQRERQRQQQCWRPVSLRRA